MTSGFLIKFYPILTPHTCQPQSPVPFLWTLDLGFGTWIWDLDLGPGFGTWILDLDLGLDLDLTIENLSLHPLTAKL